MKTVIDIFEKQAKKFSNNFALIFDKQEMTYKDLNEQSNGVAVFLKQQNIHNSTVAILSKKSIEMFTAIFGILKSGNSFLLLDPQYPLNRIKYILNDAKIELVLVHGLEKNLIQNISNGCMLKEIKNIKTAKEYSRNFVINCNDLACIFYTSGTTGDPKGVMISHNNLIYFAVYFVQDVLEINENSKCLFKTSCNFIASLSEIFSFILKGAQTVISKDQPNIVDIVHLIQKHKITNVFIPTSLIIPFSKYVESKQFEIQSLKIVSIAGSRLSKESYDKINMSLNKNIDLINFYGCTETTGMATYHVFNRDKNYEEIPAGKSSKSTKILILNSNNESVYSMEGEICVSGSNVFKGYLNSPGLTNKKLISWKDGLIYYKTGDLGIIKDDGNLYHLGRNDDQVKINGIRIELFEIEYQIKKLSKIDDVLVLNQPDSEGNDRLVGYIISKQKVNIKEIKESIRKELPDYMIPAYLVQIEKIPLNINGKIDKKLLPKPKIITNKNQELPLKKLEKQIISTFENILDIKPIGLNDNFFELGGDSISAIRIHIDLHEKNIFMPVNALKKNSVIKDVVNESKYISNKNSTVNSSEHKKTKLDEIVLNYLNRQIFETNGTTKSKDCEKSINSILDTWCGSQYIDPVKFQDSIEPFSLQSHHLNDKSCLIIVDVFESDKKPDYFVNNISNIIKTNDIFNMCYVKKTNKFDIKTFDISNVQIDRFIDAKELYCFEDNAIIYSIMKYFKKKHMYIKSNYKLIEILLIKISPKCYIFLTKANHAVYDQTTQKLLFDQLLYGKNTMSKSFTSYVKIINDNKNKMNYDVQDYIDRFVKHSKVFSKLYITSDIKDDMFVLKFGDESSDFFWQKPYTLISYMSKYILDYNGLLLDKINKVPLFILQEDRKFIDENFRNTAGHFVDMFPFLIDRNLDLKDLNIDKQYMALKLSKSNNYINYQEIIEKSIKKEYRKIHTVNLNFNLHSGDIRHLKNNFTKMLQTMNNDITHCIDINVVKMPNYNLLITKIPVYPCNSPDELKYKIFNKLKKSLGDIALVV